MNSQPLIAPARAAMLRRVAVTLVLVAGLGSAVIIALFEPVADLLGEGAVRVIDVDGGTRRGLMAATMALSTLVIAIALWLGRTLGSYVVAAIAALVALFAVGPFALPAVVLAVAAVVIDRAAPVERDRLSDAGPGAHPIAWGAGAIFAVGFLAVSAYLTWFLVSPLLDEGTELDETLAFAFATPEATAPTGGSSSAGGTATATPDTTPAAMAALISSGELMGTDSFHFGSGQVLVVSDPSGAGILRFEEFEFRNGPNLHVYLTPDPGGDVHADGAIDLGEVRATKGNVNYDIPEGVDLNSFRTAVIYCVPFKVVFATADLN